MFSTLFSQLLILLYYRKILSRGSAIGLCSFLSIPPIRVVVSNDFFCAQIVRFIQWSILQTSSAFYLRGRIKVEYNPIKCPPKSYLAGPVPSVCDGSPYLLSNHRSHIRRKAEKGKTPQKNTFLQNKMTLMTRITDVS